MKYIEKMIEYEEGFFHTNQYTDEQVKEKLLSQKLAYTINGDEIIHYKPLIIRENKDVVLSNTIKSKIKRLYLQRKINNFLF